MLIWILAVFLFGVVAALGYFQGAVRLMVSLAGLFLGALLAIPLSPLVKPLIPLIGVKHPMWSAVWPPIIVLSLIFFVAVGLAFFVHRKVALHYKYQTDDLTRLRWERLNKGLGLCVGLVMGGLWLFLLGLVVYVVGYPMVQVVTADTSSPVLRYVSQAREDLKTTGLEKAVAPFDPMSPVYYQVSDILGLIYNNPILLNRLSDYPPFLLMGTRTEFQEIATDAEFNTLLQSKGDVTQILNHPKTQAILLNAELLQELLHQDLKDLHQYLMTGKSAKFDEEKILGRWKLDLYSTLAKLRKMKPNMSTSEMVRLKKMVNETLSAVSFMATTDKKAVLKVEMTEAMKQATAAAQKAVAEAQARTQAGSSPAMSPEMAARYGLGRGGSPSRGPTAPRSAATPVAPPPPAAAAASQTPQLALSAQGTWERDGVKYQIKLQDEKGKEQSVEVIADDEKLTIHSPISTLVFAKAE